MSSLLSTCAPKLLCRQPVTLSAAARTDHRLAPPGAAGVPRRPLPPQRGPRECAVTRSARLRSALPQGTAVRQAMAPWFRVEWLTRPPRVGAFIEWRPQGGAPPAAGAPSSDRPNTSKVAALRAGRSCRWERSRSRAPAGAGADECGSGREEAPRARGGVMVSGRPKIAEPAHSLAIKPSCESSITLSCFYPQ